MRIECIYNNEMLYIADYYTLIEGKKIAKEGKIEALRALGRSGKLLCSCPCRGKLGLVVPNNPYRHPFFRLQKGQNTGCTAHEENPRTINAKLILKCWLDDVMALGDNEVQYNVPISQINERNRKYQYSYYVPSKRIGLCYQRIKSNIYDEKINYLFSQKDITSLFIADEGSDKFKGQYPEFASKVQNVQGYYATLLCGVETLYQDAELKIVRYEKNNLGAWEQIEVCQGKLSQFTIDNDKGLCVQNNIVSELSYDKLAEYLKSQQQKIDSQNTLKNVFGNMSLNTRRNNGENDTRYIISQRMKDFPNVVAKDYLGNRWFQCEKCKKVDLDICFSNVKSALGINYGICKECNQMNDGQMDSRIKLEEPSVGKPLYTLLKESNSRVVGVKNLKTGKRWKIGNSDYFKKSRVYHIEGYCGKPDSKEYYTDRREIYGIGEPNWVIEWEY